MAKDKTLQINVDPKVVGQRLDKFLSQIPEVGSRSRAAKLIDLNQVTVNGRTAKASLLLNPNDRIEVKIPPPQTSELVPYAIDLDILFEDQDLLVINKPAGLVVHPAAGHHQDTLVNALVHHAKDLAMGFSEERPGIVHRLDKDTSGVLVVAKHDRAQELLSRQFKQRSIHRLYWAIVHGSFRLPKGTLVSWLRRHPTDRKRFASQKLTPETESKGKKAITHYSLKLSHPCGLSLIHCKLETGRTHQIRVHMSESGHPIVGDQLYGANQRLGAVRDQEIRALLSSLHRIGLHAAELGFVHPFNGENLIFRAPWPKDLLPLVEALDWS